ncbi:GNAT family N-acetyltransferase [Candidatus Bathyarchaeota archaeon]|mgnify:CR=1 FL=1|nr:GNAT family N-acetyltransferase [Candidatus Bathyarchaeota archaeon]
MAEAAVIRNAEPSDIEAIVAIENRCFTGATAYPKSQLAYLIYKANSTCLVETCAEVIRGFIVALYRKGTRGGYLETLDVDPAYQGQGIGLRLLFAAEEEMRRRGLNFSQLEVSEGNKTAIALYQKAGYKPKKQLAGYYRFEHHGSRDAVQMVKTL